MQIIGGVLGDTYGNKIFQTICLMACAFAMGVAPAAAAMGADKVAWVYFVMGLAAERKEPPAPKEKSGLLASTTPPLVFL